MAHKPRPYERFGSFLLFRKLESDSLCEIWRAAAIEGEALGAPYAVVRFTGGDRASLRASAGQASPILPQLSGTTTVRDQSSGTTGDVPWLAWEYAGGRSLAHVIRQAQGSSDTPPNPIPVDQALAIAERAALALESTANLKHDGHRVLHGCLVPRFVWIAEDGDIRVAGHELHAGLIASLGNATVAGEIGGFFAPEIRANRQPTPASEVFSIGGILYALVTGTPPPDPLDTAKFAERVAAARMMATDEPIPAEIRAVIDRSLRLDPQERIENPAAVREAISALTHGDHYAPTTFNLAFYIHSLLRTEMGDEAAQRAKEAKVDVKPYLAPPEPRVADVPASFREAAQETAGTKQHGKRRTSLLVAIVAAVALAAMGGGYYYYAYVMNRPGSIAAAQPKAQPAQPVTPAPAPTATTTAATTTAPPASQPLVSAPTDTGGEPTKVVDETNDEAARKKLIEEEINKRLQAEMMKLQAEYDRKLKAAEAKRAQTTAPATSQPASTQKPAETAAKEATPQTQAPATQAPPTTTAATTTAAPVPATQTAAPTQPAASPAPQPPPVHEGDLVGINDVDTPPQLRHSRPPEYPALAARERVEATIIVSALISESGRVADVKILRGDSRRLGFDQAAMRAVRDSIYSPAIKDGKRVKVWMPVPVFFRLQGR